MTVLDRPILPTKASFAQHAVRKHKVTSFADLGSCWGVNAGYALDLLAKNKIDRAYVADEIITELSRDRGTAFPQLLFVQGLLSDPTLAEQIGAVDALLMYDILLHQVNPDWNRFIEMWSTRARVIIVFNPMWELDEVTVRFIDRGAAWYKEKVVFSDEGRIDEWFAKLDEIAPRNGRRWRDVHYYWQFGITRRDLIECFEHAGFTLDRFENFGAWRADKPWIQYEGFVFVRKPDKAW